MDNFTYCNDFVMTFDGVKDDAAPGETFKTSYGVTEYTWQDGVIHGLVTGTIDNCTRADADTILRVLFWQAAGCPIMPAGADLMIYANCVASGIGHAVKLAQRIVGVTQDAFAGPKTRLAIIGYGVAKFIAAMGAADEAYYATLPTANLYLHGWDRREGLAMNAAVKLMDSSAAVAPASAPVCPVTHNPCPAPATLTADGPLASDGHPTA
jgi:lysozyme family protein